MFRNAFRFLAVSVLGAAALSQAQTIPADTDFRATLMSPLDTQTSRKGDTVTAQVISPASFKGAILEGKVQESKSGGKISGTSVLNFTFDTVHHKKEVINIQSSVKEVTNSKGQKNVDEEGRVIEKKNNVGKVALTTGIGAIVGAAVGGGKGAAIGAGAGAAAGLILIETKVKGANVAFAQGTEFLLSVKERR
jgi:hypothetical protein